MSQDLEAEAESPFADDAALDLPPASGWRPKGAWYERESPFLSSYAELEEPADAAGPVDEAAWADEPGEVDQEVDQEERLGERPSSADHGGEHHGGEQPPPDEEAWEASTGSESASLAWSELESDGGEDAPEPALELESGYVDPEPVGEVDAAGEGEALLVEAALVEEALLGDRGIAEERGEQEQLVLGDEEIGDAELDEVLAFEQPQAGAQTVAFPSGATLAVVAGGDGPGSEHHDPHGTGNPLLDTGEPVRSTRLSRSFTVGELARSGGARFDRARIDPALVQCLQAIRDRVGKPVVVTSGYRSWQHNTAVYRRRGATPTKSRHCSGQAADIKVAGMSGLDLAKVALEVCGCDVAVGIGADMVHVDVRGRWTRWTYLTGSAAAAATRAIDAHRARHCAGSPEQRPEPAPTSPVPTAPASGSPAPAPPATGLRARIVEIAEQERTRWGNGRRTETDAAMTPVLQDYYRTGIGRQVAAGDLQRTTWHAGNAWSAVFVSWVMRRAGAGAHFRYSGAHRVYVAAAKGNAERGDERNPFWAYPIDRVTPAPGDLVCADRRCCATCRCNGATYENIDNGHGWCTHCDIVTAVDRGQRRITVVGGNVRHSVAASTLRIDAQGFLEPNQGGCGHFAVVKVRDLADGGARPTPSDPGAMLAGDALSKAIRLNRSYSTRLRWRDRVDAVSRLVGQPGAAFDEERFAQAVAAWQRARGLAPDGVVGPDTWAEMRRVLDARPPATTTPTTPAPAAAPPLGGPRRPDGYRMARNQRGLARYADERLDAALRRLRRQGALSVEDADLDTFQRIANVETGGKIQGLNTWDSAVVSSGFFQWTLQHGKLQEWIRRAPAAFARFGIAVDAQRTYRWGSAEPQPAIVGAATRDELRWDGWAERFFLAGLDDEVITAEVALARVWLDRHLTRIGVHLRRRSLGSAVEIFRGHYDQSPYLRGMFQAAYNNLPVAAINATVSALRAAQQEGSVSTDRFVRIYADAVLAAYRARNDDGSRIVSETKVGAAPGR